MLAGDQVEELLGGSVAPIGWGPIPEHLAQICKKHVRGRYIAEARDSIDHSVVRVRRDIVDLP